MKALTAAHDKAVQMIDTSILRVHQHGACISRNKEQHTGRSRGELTSKASPHAKRRQSRSSGCDRGLSAVLRRQMPDAIHMRDDVAHGVLAVHAHRRGGLVLQPKRFFPAPSLHRSKRTRGETTAAGRADIMQNIFHTVGAVGAFIAAYACIDRMRRKVPVTKLAIWAQFQHGNSPVPDIHCHKCTLQGKDNHPLISIKREIACLPGGAGPDQAFDATVRRPRLDYFTLVRLNMNSPPA